MSKKLVILNAVGNARPCHFPNCFNWVFVKDEYGLICCPRCKMNQPLSEEETEGAFPRPGREYEDQLNALPTYSFWVIEGGVKRVPDASGKWFETDAVRELMDQAQTEINSLRAQLAQLEPKGVPTDE